MCKPGPSSSTVLEKAEAIDNSTETTYALLSIPMHGPTATLIISVLVGLLLLLAFYKMCVHWKKSRVASRAYKGQMPTVQMPMVSYPQQLSMPMEAGKGSCLDLQQGHGGYLSQQTHPRFSQDLATAPAFQVQTLTKADIETTPDGNSFV